MTLSKNAKDPQKQSFSTIQLRIKLSKSIQIPVRLLSFIFTQIFYLRPDKTKIENLLIQEDQIVNLNTKKIIRNVYIMVLFEKQIEKAQFSALFTNSTKYYSQCLSMQSKFDNNQQMQQQSWQCLRIDKASSPNKNQIFISILLRQSIMNRKTSPLPLRVRETKQYKNQKQSIQYQATIKRQSSFFSRWKERRALIIYIPKQEFSLTLYNKNKNTIDQIVNLHLTKVSSRCSIVQQHQCFGLELKSGKRYLLGGSNKAQVSSAFDLIAGIKRLLKQNSQGSTSSHEKQDKNTKKQDFQLQFQRSNDDEQRYDEVKQQQNIKIVSTNCSPLSHTYEREYQKEEEKPQQMEIQIQRESDYCTVLQEQPMVIQQQQKNPLHLKTPLQKQQLSYLESDQNFKLLQNITQGRILSKNKQLIKANLVFKTHLTSQQFLESFFHFQLWNQKVKKYQLKNRIDEGIYLVEMELNKKSMFSSVKHCFMMVTTLIIDKELYLIMKSLDQNAFQKKKGTEWLNFSVWLKVRGEDSQKMNKFVSLCAAVQHQRDFQQILALFLQIKFYQSFLMTTNKLPARVLQWRKQQETQLFIK